MSAQPSERKPGRRGPKPRPIVEFPEPLWTEWIDPEGFAEALQLHMDRHRDTDCHLERVLLAQKAPINMSTLRMWRLDSKIPLDGRSFRALAKLEHRYRLPANYFRDKIPPAGKAVVNHKLRGISPAERRRLAWHLPDDFDTLPAARREEILGCVRSLFRGRPNIADINLVRRSSVTQ